MTRERLVALGYQGFGNLGDEAILAGIEAILEGADATVVAVIGGTRAAVAAFPAATRVASPSLWPSARGARWLASADGLLLAGGGLIHDHWRSVIPKYLGWVVLARLLRRRVVWLGVGAGPLRHRSSRWLARLLTTASDLVLVRDEASRVLLTSLAGRVDGVIPDPAYFLAPDRESPGGGLGRAEAGGHGLGLVVRAPTARRRAHTVRLVAALSDLAVASASERGVVRVATFGGRPDRAFAEDVISRARAAGVTAIYLDELDPDPSAGLAWLRCREVVVSVRLHGLILAAVAGVPFVGIAYDDKVEGVLRDLGAGELSIPLATVEAAALRAALTRAMAPETRRKVSEAVQAMTERRAEIAARVVAALR